MRLFWDFYELGSVETSVVVFFVVVVGDIVVVGDRAEL